MWKYKIFLVTNTYLVNLSKKKILTLSKLGNSMALMFSILLFLTTCLLFRYNYWGPKRNRRKRRNRCGRNIFIAPTSTYCRMLIACDSRYIQEGIFPPSIFAKCNKLFCWLFNWSHFIHTMGWIGISLDTKI